MSIPACRYIGSSSSSNWIAPTTSPSTSITRVFSSTTNSSISPGSSSPHDRTTSGSLRIGSRRTVSSCVPDRSVTRGPESFTALRSDVLVEPEDVLGVVRLLELHEPVVFLRTVDGSRDVLSPLDHVVHVVTRCRERGERVHRGAPPLDVSVIERGLLPPRLDAEPEGRLATGERHRVVGDTGDRPALQPERDRALGTGRFRDAREPGLDVRVREPGQEPALHVEALPPCHVLVPGRLHVEVPAGPAHFDPGAPNTQRPG